MLSEAVHLLKQVFGKAFQYCRAASLLPLQHREPIASEERRDCYLPVALFVDHPTDQCCMQTFSIHASHRRMHTYCLILPLPYNLQDQACMRRSRTHANEERIAETTIWHAIKSCTATIRMQHLKASFWPGAMHDSLRMV